MTSRSGAHKNAEHLSSRTSSQTAGGTRECFHITYCWLCFTRRFIVTTQPKYAPFQRGNKSVCVAFSEAGFIFTSDSIKENMQIFSTLHIYDVHECRASSLPDRVEVVSVVGRRRVSLLRISGAGVQDSRVEMQGCSARPFLRCSC